MKSPPAHRSLTSADQPTARPVYFTSTEQLTPDDHDNSNDLFVWDDSEPDALTRVSNGIGGNHGDRDDCNSTGSKTCDVQMIRPIASAAPGERRQRTATAVTDYTSPAKAATSTSISPEQLDGARGSFGEVNLYRLRRTGPLRFVTSSAPARLQPGPIARMQVTPDGNARRAS